MAFTDVTDGSRVIKEGVGMVKITLAADCCVGDLLGYNSGWVLADANGTYPAVLVAGVTAASGAEIAAYRAAKIGGITSGTAGNKLYLSDTAGDYSASAGTLSQVVGVELGGGEIYVEPEDESVSFIDNIPLYFGTANDVSLKWDSANFEILPVADDTGTFAVGDGTTDMDVKFYQGSTSHYVLFDVGGAVVTIVGDAFTMGASGTPAGDFTLWGTTANYKVLFDVNGDTNGAWYFGANDYGIDVVFYGQTSGDALTWDASAGALVATGLTKVDIGASGTPLVLTAGTPIFELYSTCASTSGSTSAEPFLVYNTMTGIGGVGGRARFYMTTNVALGGWSNALKAHAVYGASGRTTGLGSAFCGELTLSAGTTSGTYAALEAELVAEAGASAGTATSFLYMNASDAATVINSAAGYLFEIGSGVTDTAGGIFEAESNSDSLSMTHVLKIRIAGTAYYIPLNTSKGF